MLRHQKMAVIKYVVKDSDAENEKDKSYTVESLADLAEDDDTYLLTLKYLYRMFYPA